MHMCIERDIKYINSWFQFVASCKGCYLKVPYGIFFKKNMECNNILILKLGYHIFIYHALTNCFESYIHDHGVGKTHEAGLSRIGDQP